MRDHIKKCFEKKENIANFNCQFTRFSNYENNGINAKCEFEYFDNSIETKEARAKEFLNYKLWKLPEEIYQTTTSPIKKISISPSLNTNIHNDEEKNNFTIIIPIAIIFLLIIIFIGIFIYRKYKRSRVNGISEEL